MKKNIIPLQRKLKEGTIFGSFVTFGLGDIAEYTATLGFDFIVIDNEHGIMDTSTISEMIRASQCQGVPAVVRCPHGNYDTIQKALDMGANGILIPVVNSAEEAKKVVKSALYAPYGERGIAFFTRAASYGMIGNKNEFLEEENKNIFISIQIETAEAIKNLDKILTVEGIDMFFIGPNDLAASLGLDNPSLEMENIIKECILKINKAGKIAGIFVNDSIYAKKMIDLGAKFLLTSITQHMTKGTKDYLDSIKNYK